MIHVFQVERLFFVNEKGSIDVYLGVFAANCYLTQKVLFESFLAEAMLHPSSGAFVDLLAGLFVDLLADIHPDDGEEEEEHEHEISLDRRLWPASEGYNNVFVTENESCDHYGALYGEHLLSALKKLLEVSSGVTLPGLVERIIEQTSRLVDIQCKAYEQFFIRQRSTVRLKLMIDFIRITRSADPSQWQQLLPSSWTCNDQETLISPLV